MKSILVIGFIYFWYSANINCGVGVSSVTQRIVYGQGMMARMISMEMNGRKAIVLVHVGCSLVWMHTHDDNPRRELISADICVKTKSIMQLGYFG